MFCPTHKQEQLKLYCETCDKLTCRDCQLIDHRGHKYQLLEDAAPLYKQFLQTLITKIKEKRTYIEKSKDLINRRNKEIEQKEKQVTHDIKAFAILFIKLINMRGKTHIGDLKAVCSAKRKNLDEKQTQIQNFSSMLDHCLKFAEQALSSSNIGAIMFSKKILINQLKTVLRTPCEVPNPNHQVDIRFKNEVETLAKMISGAGQLIVDDTPYRGMASTQSAYKGPWDISKLGLEQRKALARQMQQIKQQQQEMNQPDVKPHHPQQFQQQQQGMSLHTRTQPGPGAAISPSVSNYQRISPRPSQQSPAISTTGQVRL